MSAGRRARLALAAGLALALALALGNGCAGEREAPRVDLANAEVAGSEPLGDASFGARIVRAGDDLWAVVTIARGAWQAQEKSGRFAAPLAVFAAGSPRAGGAPYRLRAGERDFPFESDPDVFQGDAVGRFTTRLMRVELALAPAESPPEEAELWACLAFEEAGPDGRRVGGRRLSGSGLWVPNGHPRTIALRIPPDSRLRFGTAVEPLFAAKEARLAPHTFRVRLDGALIFERRLEPSAIGEALAWQSVDLPRGGVQKAKLELEVEGPLALTSFLAPRIGPREFGTYGARPPGLRTEKSKDLVVFLADTFRADNLAAYGSQLGLTPEIDRFAAESRTFARTWSTSTHTLASHGSLFSGVYPPQNGQSDYFNPLPGAVETLAERLSAHGYRCGLVSDGGMVSRAQGFDQGFESFDERKELDTLARARAFLEADDGRPIFLFVQSYHVHAPYDVEETTRTQWGSELALDRNYNEVMSTPLIAALEHAPPAREAPPADAAGQDAVRRLHDLYRGKVAELDGLFARFRSELEARGLFEHGILCFTSDHGEAFLEHGVPFHAGRVYEEQLRVPLILHGPGIGTGRSEGNVSLIDFAPTLCALAGIEVPALYRGRSLLAPPEKRVLYAFQANRGHGPSTLAVIDGERKLVSFDDAESVSAGKLHAAFDLSEDPTEQKSQLDQSWPTELERAHHAELEKLLVPLVTPERLSLTPDKLEELGGLGYTGRPSDEDDEKPKVDAKKEDAQPRPH